MLLIIMLDKIHSYLFISKILYFFVDTYILLFLQMSDSYLLIYLFILIDFLYIF